MLLGATGETAGWVGDAPVETLEADAEADERLAARLHEIRRHKGMDEAAAREAVRAPLVRAALMVRGGEAAGSVAGAATTTADVVRAALQIIGKRKDAAIVSSFFLILPPEGEALLFADCGLVVAPDAAELAAIATSTAASRWALLGDEPRVAMLSFSTRGSARHERADAVVEATRLARGAEPGLAIDGELQFDAAFVPAVAEAKAPGSAVGGRANVMVFPDLGAGNIGYKIAQRLGGCGAVGPILQGLARPANDLSRGCSVEDVVNMIAVTAAQSADASA